MKLVYYLILPRVSARSCHNQACVYSLLLALLLHAVVIIHWLKIKVEIKIKSLLRLNKIERCKMYVSLLAIDTRRLTHILQHAQLITLRPLLYRNTWWKKVINKVAYNDEKQQDA